MPPARLRGKAVGKIRRSRHFFRSICVSFGLPYRSFGLRTASGRSGSRVNPSSEGSESHGLDTALKNIGILFDRRNAVL